MTVLLTVLATIGWLAAFGMLGIFRLLAKLYTLEKMQNEALRNELNNIYPNWYNWPPAND